MSEAVVRPIGASSSVPRPEPEPMPSPAVRVLRDVEATSDAGAGELLYPGAIGDRLEVSGGRVRSASGPHDGASADDAATKCFRATVESLVALGCTATGGPFFVARSADTMATEPFFPTADLLPAIGAFEEPRAAEEARRLLDRVLRGGGEGHAFVPRRHGPPLPVAALRSRFERVDPLLALGAWTVHVLHVAGHDLGEAPPTIGELDGTATVVFAYDDVVYALPCPDPRLLPLKVVCVEGVLRVLRDARIV